MDILTIGEVLIDLTQTGKDARGIPQFAANPGGAPANLAVAASRLGAQTAFIGKVGADAFGRYLKEVLAENKVDVFRHGGGCRPPHHHGSRVGGCHRRAGFQLLPQRQR